MMDKRNNNPLLQANDWRETRRFQAVALKAQGWQQAQIAQELGVTPGAVSQWLKRAREKGPEALRTYTGRRQKPRLQEEQIRQLPDLLAKGPQAYGFGSTTWTHEQIIALIQQVYDVRFSHGHIGRILRKSGVRLRQPAQRAEQNR
jgi:transposase